MSDCENCGKPAEQDGFCADCNRAAEDFAAHTRNDRSVYLALCHALDQVVYLHGLLTPARKRKTVEKVNEVIRELNEAITLTCPERQ